VSAGKILVVRGGAIGDFILTLPVFAALRETFPNARLEALAYSNVASLAQAGGLIDAVRSIESRSMAGFFASKGPLDESLSEFFGGFAVIISYLYDPDGIFQANVARCSKAQFIVGPHRPDDRGRIHATEVLLKPLERIAVYVSDPVPRLRLPRNWEILPNIETGTIRLAVHPGSGSEQKNWPEHKWMEALDKLMAIPGLSLLLIGGEAEGDRLERVAPRLPSNRLTIAHQLPLVELARQISLCHAFLGHDSGISHLAAALGIPVLALWGHTSELVWRPLGSKVILLNEPNGLEQLTVERVVENIIVLLQN